MYKNVSYPRNQRNVPYRKLQFFIKLLMRVEGNRIGGRNNFGGKRCNMFYKTKSPNTLRILP